MSGGPMTGLAGLLRGELARWLGRLGLVHLVVWTALIQTQLYLGVDGTLGTYRSQWGFELVVRLLWVFPLLGAIVMAQGLLADERAWGTAPWVAAHPVRRPAIVVAKVLGNGVPLALVSVVLQGLLAWWWLPGTIPHAGLEIPAPETGPYLTTLGVLSLLVVLLVALGVALGSLFRSRAVVVTLLGVALFFLVSTPGDPEASWRDWSPGELVGDGTDGSYNLLVEHLFGDGFDGGTQVAAAAILTVFFTLLGAWRFSHEEL